MSSSLSLVAKYLDASKKSELALKLTDDLGKNADSLVALCELLDVIDTESKELIYPRILEFANLILDNKDKHTDDNYSDILMLMKKLPQLYKSLLQKIITHFELYISDSPLNFLPEIRDIISRSDEYGVRSLKPNTTLEGQALDNEYILSLFQFLEYVFVRLNGEIQGKSEIDPILCYFIGVADESIAAVASKLLRWRVESIVIMSKDTTFVWDILYALEKTDNKIHRSNAFVFWLRYLNSSNSNLITNSDIYQRKILNSEKYWKIIQNGLNSNSHDHRKFCLSLLQLSVKSIKSSFKNEILTWDSTLRDQHLKEWARYITLFEILGVDTSLHQAEAGVNDIVGLISPTSLIHPSWGFCLLSTGFKASMDSVRKFSLSLLLSIPLENLYLIKYGLEYLEGVYLPYAMLAPHFSVKLMNGVNECQCEYGERLCEFVASLLNNLKTEADFEDVAFSILKVLDKLKDAFDPARVYVTLGLLRGLDKKQVLSFSRHDAFLLRLFESNSEGDLFECANQTMNLRLVLNFRLTSLNNFIKLLDKFIKFNGFKIVDENLSLIVNYLESNNVSYEKLMVCLKEEEMYSSDLKALIVGLSNSFFSDKTDEVLEVLNKSDLILAKVLRSNFKLDVFQTTDGSKIVESFFARVLKGEGDFDLFETLSEIDFTSHRHFLPSGINLIELWAVINAEVQSDDRLTLSLLVNRLKFLNNILDAIPLVKIENHEIFDIKPMVKFNEFLFINSKEVSKNFKTFYKVIDDAFGEYYRILSHSLQKQTPTEIEIDNIIKVINPSCTHYHSSISLVKLLKNILLQECISLQIIMSTVESLGDIWDNLNSSRLQLNQKDLHVLIINTLLQPKIINASINNETISKRLFVFGRSIIENAEGRRCLLPSFTKNLSNYQIYGSASFEKIDWIPELLVRSFTVFQLKSNVFRLENVIGKLYDEKISLNKENNIYNNIYGSEEISAKINLMAIFNSIRSSEYSYKIFRFIIDNEEEFNLFNVVKNTDGFEEWRRIQLFTIIISIIDKIDSEVIISQYVPTFIKLIETEPSPLVRAYIEWIVAINLLKSDELTTILFDRLKALIDLTGLKPAVVTAYERILFLMIQQLPHAKESKALGKFLTVIVPGATSNKAMTRHFSVSLICSIYPEIQSKKLAIEPELVIMIENMYKSAVNSESFGQYRSGDALLWDIKQDLNLVSIAGALLMRLTDRDVEFITKEDYLEHLSQAQIDHLTHPVGENMQELWIRERKSLAKKSVQTKMDISQSVSQSPLQTKSGAWNTIMDIDATSNGADIIRSDLIVVSSLVDKPPNLGGICRLCDVLGAGLLTLNDINVKNHPQFKNVAVTADYWMPMLEVKPSEIISFLKEKKKEGYTLIGLEQTDKSVELNSDLKFPKKSLILLGREKEGVPGDLLAELDFCVEIKQVGVIRSMNIQTATAIIVHAYSTQHC
ncbi:uncharacterized protein AC631_03840 [Debaryomyces fabryi]|uniref:tRNA/rRNA methyltransferase SpoU type domain-containing protein n=1 Tax=Debaryomyces fabryi TaxID=58627 RepID=A0A0V1PVW9_9ASCO|nr:uncharacterized protein AC631_03840 [Debaryomyces fabryi]KSA00413.1 hypothetical protein AC631_03840 [Debaryomyces fabryi]CUM54139.1 unnamed protein product [Debaryomyces fabryi]